MDGLEAAYYSTSTSQKVRDQQSPLPNQSMIFLAWGVTRGTGSGDRSCTYVIAFLEVVAKT